MWRILLPPMPAVPVCRDAEPIYYKYTPKPEYGYLNLAKRGATTHELLIGADYYVYTDAWCTSYANDKNGNHTLRVNSKMLPIPTPDLCAGNLLCP